MNIDSRTTVVPACISSVLRRCSANISVASVCNACRASGMVRPRELTPGSCSIKAMYSLLSFRITAVNSSLPCSIASYTLFVEQPEAYCDPHCETIAVSLAKALCATASLGALRRGQAELIGRGAQQLRPGLPRALLWRCSAAGGRALARIRAAAPPRARADCW
jgi:hypothetical protein